MVATKKAAAKREYIITSVFIAAELAIWIILLGGFSGTHKYFAYGGVLLCLLFSSVLASVPPYEKRLTEAPIKFMERGRVLQLGAFIFTALADLFLILLEGRNKTLAMVFFLTAQIFYALRVLRFFESKRARRAVVYIRIALSLVGAAAVFAVLGAKTEALFVISVVYYVNLVFSLILSVICHSSTEAKITAIGLLSFALCDISIGFDFLIDIFSLTEGNFIYDLMHSPIHFVDLFYPPSQTLLAVSVLKEHKCK